MLIKDVPTEFCKTHCNAWNKERGYCNGIYGHYTECLYHCIEERLRLWRMERGK